jgi:hypothetical protein
MTLLTSLSSSSHSYDLVSIDTYPNDKIWLLLCAWKEVLYQLVERSLVRV